MVPRVQSKWGRTCCPSPAPPSGIFSNKYPCFFSKSQNLRAGKKFGYLSCPKCHPFFFFSFPQNKAKGNQDWGRWSKPSKVTQLVAKSGSAPRAHGSRPRPASSAVSIYSFLLLSSPSNTHIFVTSCENVDDTALKLITSLQPIRKAKSTAILS